ncbi:MAG: phospholipase D-like domain-containing protein [Chitinophagaceae bacterium]
MSIDLKVYNNGDHICLVWFPADGNPIAGCRGYAIERTLTRIGKKTTGYLHNFTGFKQGDSLPDPAWKWPVQRYLWWDYSVKPGDVVEYTIIPVTGSYSPGPLQLKDALKSNTSKRVNISGQDGKAMSAYFNKGIIASQWVAKELQQKSQDGAANRTTLSKIIATPGDPLRNALSGLLRTQILALMDETIKSGGKIFAALYELNDPELLNALKAMGSNASLILANGAFKPPDKDENAVIRKQLKDTTKINVFDRIVSSGHFAHNKFVVFCDKDGKAERVLTGSTNWTVTGLCTQANNALIINDAVVAEAFLHEWQLIRQAGNNFPPELITSNSAQKTFQVDSAKVTVWFTPTDAQEDLQQARQLINQAKEGILFLFFNPGPYQDDPARWTLLQSILNRHQEGNNPSYNPDLYIHGVVNQEIPKLTEEAKLPQKTGIQAAANELYTAARAHPVVLFAGGTKAPEPMSQEVQVPASIKANFASWVPELLGMSMVNVHSKVVVIDPFGDHPILMTGSHNLGPKASAKNDDNLVIVEGNPALAQAHAVNIIAIYQQYRWRNYVNQHTGDPKAWHGLQDDDKWQTGYLTTNKAEMEFWLGITKQMNGKADTKK